MKQYNKIYKEYKEYKEQRPTSSNKEQTFVIYEEMQLLLVD